MRCKLQITVRETLQHFRNYLCPPPAHTVPVQSSWKAGHPVLTCHKCTDITPAAAAPSPASSSRRSALLGVLCSSTALLAAAQQPPSSEASIIEEDVADRVFLSAASSVVSVADFRRDANGAEISEVSLTNTLSHSIAPASTSLSRPWLHGRNPN